MNKKSIDSSRNCFAAAYLYFIRKLRELNLFSSNPFWSPSLNTAEQILTTRLFLLFLFVSLLTVIVYTSLIVQTHTITLEEFTLADFESLPEKNLTLVSVPCGAVSNPYHEFIHLSATLHPVCSSPFVESAWISSLYLPNETFNDPLDFRGFAFAQFQSLALLCHAAVQALHDGLRGFNATHLVTGQMFKRVAFTETIDVIIKNFQDKLLEHENRTAKIVSLSMDQNGFMSALRTNYFIQSKDSRDNFLIYSELYLRKNTTSSCNCRLQENQCTYSAFAFPNSTSTKVDKLSMSNPTAGYRIPGLLAGCLPMESLRQSTLECLYDQSCIDILALQPNISHPKPLPQSAAFLVNATVGSMFSQSLFVESWQRNASFERYCELCAPQSLTYTKEGRFRLAAIVTTSISAFGGLVILWELITPAFVKISSLFMWRRRKHPCILLEPTSSPATAAKASPRSPRKAVASYVNRRVRTFNLFPPDDENDVEETKVGIISTRLYILLLLSGLIVLGFYTSLVERTQTDTILSPSLSRYNELRKLHPRTLVCSCASFSMSYGRIMSISPRYHPICSSMFIKKAWLSYFDLFEVNLNSTFFIARDFRISGQSFFTTMRDLCQTAMSTVANSIRTFHSRRLVTINVLSKKEFTDLTKIRLKQFEQETKASYFNLPELLISTFHVNHLITNALTSAAFSTVFDNRTSTWTPSFHPQDIYNASCSCALSSQCIRPQGFYLQDDNDNLYPKVLIPGLFLGCYTIDSNLLSSLECFFNKTCVQMLLDMYHFDAVGSLQPLHIDIRNVTLLRKNSTRFAPNDTVASLVSQMFIEDWGTSSNFRAYYEKCAPTQCTYTWRSRFDRAYMVAMMLGFYSGLGAILEIILPHIVRFIRRLWKRRRASTRTETPTRETPASHRCRSMFRSLRSLNLFVIDRDSADEERTRHEIIATRTYVILFILSLVVVLLYAGPFTDEMKTTVINRPTAQTVADLYSKQIPTLSCPCSTAAINHSTCLSIVPEYHPICTSDYVKPSYLIELMEKKDPIASQIAAHYSILAALCYQSPRIVQRAIEAFGARELVSAEAMTNETFVTQTEPLVDTFIAQIPANYRRANRFIARSFAANHLLNVFTKNWQLEFTGPDEQYIMRSRPYRFPLSNCTCALSFDCSEPVHENIVSGCFPADGFRLSKFQNTTFGLLSDALFVVGWDLQKNYTAYFQACQPLECRYTLPDRNNPVLMLMAALGIYGGLICALRLIVGQSLHAYRWWVVRRRTPAMHTSFVNPMTVCENA